MYSISIYFGNLLCQALEKNDREESALESALMFTVNEVAVSCEPQKLKQETRPHNENCYNSSM